MSSIHTERNGRRLIEFHLDGKRRRLRLGNVSLREAESVQSHVDDLAACLAMGQSPRNETVAWVNRLSDVVHGRLAACGLVKARATIAQTRLGPFIESYITGRKDAKPRTIINYRHACKEITQHFGADRVMASINVGEADEFRQALLGRGLAENTVRRVCGRARQFFRAAIRREMLTRNPFDGMKCSVGANPDRLYFVTMSDALKVLDACPDTQMKLIFALARFGGLRCPSEHLALRWSDVNWEKDRFTVRSPKTEHHEGKAFRLVPIFPELRPYLLKAFEEAAAGSEFVVTRCRSGETNLRTQFTRIIGRAGLKPWPKLFQNLRATRETELNETFPMHVVCSWIGHSATVAMKHYLQVTEEHYQKAGQNPGQHMHETTRKPSQRVETLDSGSAVTSSSDRALRVSAKTCNDLRNQAIPPRGVEPLFAD
jgi:integrase